MVRRHEFGREQALMRYAGSVAEFSPRSQGGKSFRDAGRTNTLLGGKRLEFHFHTYI